MLTEINDKNIGRKTPEQEKVITNLERSIALSNLSFYYT